MATKGLVKRIYRSQTEDMLLYGFVQGQKTLIPTITISQAVRNFGRVFGLFEEGFDEKQAEVTYYRMLNKYNDACKTTENPITKR